jgi:hypothetical protein
LLWYRLYGLGIGSTLRLPFPKAAKPQRTDIAFQPGSARKMREARRALVSHPRFFRHVTLPDGSDYLWWPRLFEFIISHDGSRISYRCLDQRRREGFLTYLLSHALSFALIKRGLEPLHGTAVVIGNGAVVFLGDSGYGKSTLAATLLRSGYRLLTDDLLIVRPSSGRGMVAYPGPPRIKLIERGANVLLPDLRQRAPMNLRGGKLVIPLPNGDGFPNGVPIRAFYVLMPPRAGRRRSTIQLRPLSQRQAFLALTRNTFNARLASAARLAQLFELTTRVVAEVPVKALAYPRRFSVLPKVRDRLLEDLTGTPDGKSAAGLVIGVAAAREASPRIDCRHLQPGFCLHIRPRRAP